MRVPWAYLKRVLAGAIFGLYMAHLVYFLNPQIDISPVRLASVTIVYGLICGVLFGTAIVTLMLTADARLHEILQISVDRFVKPVRIYVVKNPDGTPKRDPTSKRIVTDVIVEQRLLPKGRQRDDLRLQYDVSAARQHLQEITRLLKAAHGGQVPVVFYTNQHPKAAQLGAERYLFPRNRARGVGC